MGGDDAQTHADMLAQRYTVVGPSLVMWFRRRIGDAVEAEDLAQESFLRVINRTEGAALDNFDAYLFRTARSVLADRRRRRMARHADAHDEMLDSASSENPDAVRTMLARERLREASAVLMALPERTRAIFILSRLEEMRYAEIAIRLGISVSAVQKHMLRAIERLLEARGSE